MTDLQQLISLTIEIEGILRVLADRNDADARTLLQAKVAEFNILLADAHTEAVGAQHSAPSPASDMPNAEQQHSVAAPEPSEKSDKAAPAPAHIAPPIPNIRKNLTINDKFLFRRELFGGNDAEFNDTLDLIATMHNYEEAVEYLVEDLAWDTEDETVIDFLEFVNNHFKSL